MMLTISFAEDLMCQVMHQPTIKFHVRTYFIKLKEQILVNNNLIFYKCLIIMDMYNVNRNVFYLEIYKK